MEKFSLNEIKLAVINEDLKKLQELSNKEPSFSSLDEAKEINFYIKQAINLLICKRNEVFKEMQKIKQLKKFKINENRSYLDFKS